MFCLLQVNVPSSGRAWARRWAVHSAAERSVVSIELGIYSGMLWHSAFLAWAWR